jgi:hypothetical protein
MGLIGTAPTGLAPFAANPDLVEGKGPLTIAVNGPHEYARQDLNLQPLAPEGKETVLEVRGLCDAIGR